MGLIRYSCGHISGPHEPIPTKFGLWMFFIMLHRYMVSRTLKCKKNFCDVITSVLYIWLLVYVLEWQNQTAGCHLSPCNKSSSSSSDLTATLKIYEYYQSKTGFLVASFQEAIFTAECLFLPTNVSHKNKLLESTSSQVSVPVTDEILQLIIVHKMITPPPLLSHHAEELYIITSVQVFCTLVDFPNSILMNKIICIHFRSSIFSR